MSAEVTAAGTFEFRNPVRLFRNDALANDLFDVAADGQRFIVSSSAGQALTTPFTVVVNWTADLKR
jgi:hypothetical protein